MVLFKCSRANIDLLPTLGALYQQTDRYLAFVQGPAPRTGLSFEKVMLSLSKWGSARNRVWGIVYTGTVLG